MLSGQAIALRLPDLPRWVEVRDILLGGEGEVFGLQEEPKLSFVLREPGTASLFVVGTPTVGAIEAAVQAAGQDANLIVPQEGAGWPAQVLPGWSRTAIIVHVLPDRGRLPAVGGEVRFLDAGTLPGLPIAEELRQELDRGAEYSPIAATFVGDQPVSFCYAGSVTESLWDVSIDTLPEHRRKGYAAACAAYMIRYMEAQGKRPVWQAEARNPASWRLAEKLGFVAVDELVLFERR